MKQYKIYIIGVLFLIIGLLIGWYIRPQTPVTTPTVESHDNHSPESMVNHSEEIWTCSMHPQIRQNEVGICPICEMDLIVLDNSMSNDDPTILQMSEEAVKLAQVATFLIGNSNNKVTKNYKNSEISVEGTIELDERTIKSQTVHLAGRLDEMFVTFEGQYIAKGQKIATLYSTELLAASQELITASQFDDRIEGLTDAAIQKLKNWKISETQIKSILTTKIPIETIDVVSDYNGYVLKKSKSQGDHVKQGEALYSIGSTSNLWLMFNVFESDLTHINIGDLITVKTPSLSHTGFKAKVTYINPLLNPSTRTASIRAEIANRSNRLKPGMLITGLVSTKRKTEANKNEGPISIPKTAILWTGKESVVYVKVENLEVPTFQFRQVVVGDQSGNSVLIIKGLKEGEEVVVNGAFAIDAAAQLNNSMSMMNKNVTMKNSMETDVVPSFSESVSDLFKDQLEEGLAAYIILKDALVDTDSKAGRLSADIFLNAIQKVNGDTLEDEAKEYWVKQLNILVNHGVMIRDEGEDIENQRSQFYFVSQAMINSVKAFGTTGKVYYVQHCPMAKNNEGADWISTEDSIRNPYFGDKMMKCGIVKIELY